MDYLGIIGFCIGFGWIPIAMIISVVVVTVEKIKEVLNDRIKS